MAKENVKAFFEAMSKDETIQQALKEKELGYTGIMGNLDAVMEEVVIPVAKKAGYDFTLEELNEYEKSMRVSMDDELDEDMLEQIAGGASSGGFWNSVLKFLARLGGG